MWNTKLIVISRFCPPVFSFALIPHQIITVQYNHVPRQIVTPYKPSEDIEQTPLLPSTPTSPDSLQTASGYFAETNHTFMNAHHSAQTNDGFNSSFDFPQHPHHQHQNSSVSSTPVTAAAAAVIGTGTNAGFTSSNPFVNLDNSTTATTTSTAAHNKIHSEGGGFTNILEDESFTKVQQIQSQCHTLAHACT